MRHIPRGGVWEPEDPCGYWTCDLCGHIIRWGEDYLLRGGELRCEECMEEGYASEDRFDQF